MITYYINRFIHSIIRENRLSHLMEMMLKGNKKDVLLSDFIKQLEKFLKLEHDVLFDESKLKYIIFLEKLKSNV